MDEETQRRIEELNRRTAETRTQTEILRELQQELAVRGQ
jgi:hypothetical protein